MEHFFCYAKRRLQSDLQLFTEHRERRDNVACRGDLQRRCHEFGSRSCVHYRAGKTSIWVRQVNGHSRPRDLDPLFRRPALQGIVDSPTGLVAARGWFDARRPQRRCLLYRAESC